MLTDYTLLINDWRGYIIGGFALVWVANIYMSLFGLLRTGIKKEKTEVKALENEVESNATGTGKQRKISPWLKWIARKADQRCVIVFHWINNVRDGAFQFTIISGFC